MHEQACRKRATIVLCVVCSGEAQPCQNPGWKSPKIVASAVASLRKQLGLRAVERGADLQLASLLSFCPGNLPQSSTAPTPCEATSAKIQTCLTCLKGHRSAWLLREAASAQHKRQDRLSMVPGPEAQAVQDDALLFVFGIFSSRGQTRALLRALTRRSSPGTGPSDLPAQPACGAMEQL